MKLTIKNVADELHKREHCKCGGVNKIMLIGQGLILCCGCGKTNTLTQWLIDIEGITACEKGEDR